MKQKKKLWMSGLAFVIAATIGIGSTFAWYVSRTVSESSEVETAIVTVCALNLQGGENMLPGESLYLKPEEPNIYFLSNPNSRDMVVQISFDGFIEGYLPKTAVPPQELIDAGDYEYDTKKDTYKITQQRMEQIARGYVNTHMYKGVPTNLDHIVEYNNCFFYNVPAYEMVEVGDMYINFLPDFGGTWVNPADHQQSISRQFEQQTQFLVSYHMLACQKGGPENVAETALTHVFGQDVVDYLKTINRIDFFEDESYTG